MVEAAAAAEGRVRRAAPEAALPAGAAAGAPHPRRSAEGLVHRVLGWYSVVSGYLKHGLSQLH